MIETPKTILEALGYDELPGLTDAKGGDLGLVKVPYLPSLMALRFQSKLMYQYNKLLTVDKDKPAEVMSVIYDEEGIDLQVKILKAALGLNEDQLSSQYSVASLNKIYAHILQRDFKLDDLMQGFADRFGGMFKVDENPPKTPAS